MQRDFSIASSEHDREEWKEVFNEELLEEALQTLCGFLNRQGGKIIFGVNAQGQANNLQSDLDGAQRKIYDSARAHLKPNAHSLFDVKIHEGLLYIFVKSDPNHLYQYRHVTYKRTGSSTHALSHDESKILEGQRKNHVREIAEGVFSRTTQGEVLRCPAGHYQEVSGLSINMSLGAPPQQKRCPTCGQTLVSNL